jgi:hypothetical protein
MATLPHEFKNGIPDERRSITVAKVWIRCIDLRKEPFIHHK